MNEIMNELAEVITKVSDFRCPWSSSLTLWRLASGYKEVNDALSSLIKARAHLGLAKERFSSEED